MRVTVHVRGVGGQALPFIVSMLGRRAAEANVAFTSREVFGMAQRGGSVFAMLELEAPDQDSLPPDSPAAGAGERLGPARSVLLGLELLEGFRGLSVLRPGEQAILSTAQVIPPGSWASGRPAYPTREQVSEVAAQHGIELTLVDAAATAPWAVVQAAIDRGAIPLGPTLSGVRGS